MSVDLSPYLQQENSVRNDFAAKSAANAFSRTLAQQRGDRQMNDFRMGFRRQLPSFTSSFGRRGMTGGGINSGVYRNAMQNYVGDYTRNLGQMQQDYSGQLQQFDFDQQRFVAERDNALANIAAQKAAMIASTAQQIAALKPYMGG